jgi:hypothetical protein
MSPYINNFDGMFWLGVGGVVGGLIAIACKYCYRCKCSDISICWNLLKIKRDVVTERIQDQLEDQSSDEIPTPPNRSLAHMFQQRK